MAIQREATYEEELAELVRSLDEAEDEAERNGPVSPEEVDRMLEDAKAHRSRRGKGRQSSDRRVVHES